MPIRLSELVLVTLAATCLAVLFTWPLAPRLASAGRVDSGDGRYSIWNVAWVAHALETHPLGVYDANIFHPHARALTFSEANLVAGALGWPVWRATRNPHATSNAVILLSFVLAGVTTYLLVMRLAANRAAAAVAAVAFAFNPFVFSHLPHVQLLMTFGLPLVLLSTHAFTDRPTTGRAAALGATMALTGLACGYYGVFGGLTAGLGVVWFGFVTDHARDWRYWGRGLLAAAVAAALLAPFFAPYLDIQAAGFERSLDEARVYSMGWSDYLASARLAERWMLPYLGLWVDPSFPGFVTLGLALVAVAGAVRAGRRASQWVSRPVVGFYGLLTVLALWASLGPAGGLYTALHATLPFFTLLRAPSRFGVLVILALAVLSGIGLASLSRRQSLSARRWTSAVLILASLASASVGPLALTDAPPVNAVYRQLAVLPRAPVVELPYFNARGELHRHTEYMLMSTYHWQPLVNGYSDHQPAAAVDDMARLATFPSAEAWLVINAHRVRYVVVHWHIYDDDGRVEMVRQAVEAAQDRLRVMLETPEMSLYEVTRWDDGSGR